MRSRILLIPPNQQKDNKSVKEKKSMRRREENYSPPLEVLRSSVFVVNDCAIVITAVVTWRKHQS